MMKEAVKEKEIREVSEPHVENIFFRGIKWAFNLPYVEDTEKIDLLGGTQLLRVYIREGKDSYILDRTPRENGESFELDKSVGCPLSEKIYNALFVGSIGSWDSKHCAHEAVGYRKEGGELSIKDEGALETRLMEFVKRFKL